MLNTLWPGLSAILTSALLTTGVSTQAAATPPPAAAPTQAVDELAETAPSEAIDESNDAGRFGPTGEHWPELTPKPSDAFEQVVNVPADWNAIAEAIRNAPAGEREDPRRPGRAARGLRRQLERSRRARRPRIGRPVEPHPRHAS